MEIPKVLRSSEKEENLSLTVKGLLVLVIIAIIKQLGFETNESEALILAELIIVIVASIGTMFGIVRKLINSKDIDK